MTEFLDKELLEKSNQGILIDNLGSKNLLVSFGGISQGLGVPVFEFFNSIEHLKCDKIFLRDFSQMWYQKGVDENINDLIILEEFIKHKINKYNKVVFLGNSMGGYAAILLGVLLKVNNVISFSPQTFIDKKNRLFFWDRRWRKQIRNIHLNKKRHSKFFDLKKSFKDVNNYKPQIDIYYSSKHRLDKIHAERLKSFRFVKLHSYTEGGHSVVKTLRDTGELQKILFNLFK